TSGASSAPAADASHETAARSRGLRVDPDVAGGGVVDVAAFEGPRQRAASDERARVAERAVVQAAKEAVRLVVVVRGAAVGPGVRRRRWERDDLEAQHRGEHDHVGGARPWIHLGIDDLGHPRDSLALGKRLDARSLDPQGGRHAREEEPGTVDLDARGRPQASEETLGLVARVGDQSSVDRGHADERWDRARPRARADADHARAAATAAYGKTNRAWGERKRSSLRRALRVKSRVNDVAARSGKRDRARSTPRVDALTMAIPPSAAKAIGHEVKCGMACAAWPRSSAAPWRPGGYPAQVWLAGPRRNATRRRKPDGLTSAPETTPETSDPRTAGA